MSARKDAVYINLIYCLIACKLQMVFITASARLHLIKDIKEAVAYYISIRNDR